MTDSYKYANASFPVSALYIQIDTNTGPNGDSNIQLFKRGMIKMPRMNTPPLLTSEYPFFTKHVRYPSSIERKDWKTKYEFFFNRVLFIDRLRKEIARNPDIYKERLTSRDETESNELYEWMQETEKHNVMVTLRALFPIPEAFGKTLKHSYNHILKNDMNSRVIWDVNVRSAVNIFGFMYKFGIANKEKEEYFLNIGGKRYEVDDVVWENDVINHPVYREFLQSQRETFEDVAKSALEVEDKYEGFLQKLTDELTTLELNELVQKEVYCTNNQNKCDDEEEQYKFLKEKIKTANNSQIDKFIRDNSGNINPEFKSIIHTYTFKYYYDTYTDPAKYKANDPEQHHINTLKTSYDANEKIIQQTQQNRTSLLDPSFNEHWDLELTSSYYLDQLDHPSQDDTSDAFRKRVEGQIYVWLKSESIFMMRRHILAKNVDIMNSNTYNLKNDRKNTILGVTEKLKRLSVDIGEEVAANLIISIKEDFDNHQKLHSNEGISVFMEKEYEILFERLVKTAVEIKASFIVLQFAKNNIPMNLTGKNPDGTDVSPIMKRINKYIVDFYGTEASINNKLSTNVNNVFEPVRKTSNRELYKVLKLIKFGDAVMKREYKMLDADIDEYRDVLDRIHNKYISISVQNENDNVDEYLYTGVDEVKSAGGGEEKKNEAEIRRNVQEIYVRMDLVDADTLEKVSRGPCKLLDKEMEQEFKYLADPRNKNNSSLSRFRDTNILPRPPKGQTQKEEPPKQEEKKMGGRKTHKNSRTGKWTRRIR